MTEPQLLITSGAAAITALSVAWALYSDARALGATVAAESAEKNTTFWMAQHENAGKSYSFAKRTVTALTETLNLNAVKLAEMQTTIDKLTAAIEANRRGAKRDKVLAIREAHPDWSYRRIAAEAGCDDSNVARVLGRRGLSRGKV